MLLNTLLKLHPEGPKAWLKYPAPHLSTSANLSLKRNATLVAIWQISFTLPQPSNWPLRDTGPHPSCAFLRMDLDYIYLCIATPGGKYHTNKR